MPPGSTGLTRPPSPRPQPTASQPASSAVAKPNSDQATPRVVMRQKPPRYGNRPSIFGPLTSTTIAGQPLALWILLGVGLLTVIVLAAIVFVRAAG